ncbi:hypothetical protein BASA60_009947 [Batrachochytrium salamandrivorans]|nr:hypothetical protein BASA60_009947 [Batrachochytrium salamandrivorans]KAH6569503.1 hypothetical protein BASA62_004875 [Batrachochytrium salamandrivorans]KAH9252703.1 hypothetical protein BASA81_009397 [Batrachochytrium salamandrivorans]KAH9267495.1 hypothetical protein BASA83_009883 [Batrachochytrium salamandrivorans]
MTGNFEKDYVEACRRMGIKHYNILKLGAALPPLPNASLPSVNPLLANPRNPDTAQNSIVTDASARRSIQGLVETHNHVVSGKLNTVLDDSNDDHGSNPLTTTRPAAAGFHPDEASHTATNAVASSTAYSPGTTTKQHRTTRKHSTINSTSSTVLLQTETGRSSLLTASYPSRFKFTPTITIETNETEDDEEVYRIQVRGWKLASSNLEALNSAINSCATITHLTLWNCGLTETHFNALATVVPTTNIRVLSLDQNPLIPEYLYATLFSDDLSLKSISLGGNGITDNGIRAFSAAIKTNRSLTHLSLWNNQITQDGAEMLAESLRFGCNLQALSIGKNAIGNDGAISFSKILSNYLLSEEELKQRRQQLADIDRLRHDMEDDMILKKKGRAGRGTSAKIIDDKKDDKGKRTAKLVVKKGSEVTSLQRPLKTPDDKSKKLMPVVPDDKKGKEKKAVLPIKGEKKSKIDDNRDDMDESVEFTNGSEPMFESNGQWYILGNRTLNSLNISHNSIGELGLKALLDAVINQEATNDQSPEGMLGIFRIAMQHNSFDTELSLYTQLMAILNSRNPFFETLDIDTVHDGVATEPAEVAQADSESTIDEGTQQ